jgi:peptidoglycan/xylan/chitin deacetylase (PgdA/CDA1 family)
VREALRPCTVAEIRRVKSGLVEFGAHGHTHAIGRNETVERRRHEVCVSVSKVSEWTGRPVRFFCYPNGESGDFGDIEKTSLRLAGVRAAVSGIGGANTAASDLYELRRYPVTIDHDDVRFRAEIAGLRTALISAVRRKAR